MRVNFLQAEQPFQKELLLEYLMKNKKTFLVIEGKGFFPIWISKREEGVRFFSIV